MKLFQSIIIIPLLNLVFNLAFVSPVHAQTFSFGAAGDFANGSNFQATATQMGSQNLDFGIALGDLAYSTVEQSWCNTIKSKLNNILLISGNHDSGESSAGNINTYVQYCPYTLTSPLIGTYGKQYYFDYPAVNPTARFIMISPGLGGSFIGMDTNYSIGHPGYTFVQNAVDDARSKSIKWIVVGMHKNYISVLEKGNELGPDLIPMLINKRVDLILQGHEHGYERSKQLSCIKTGTPNPACFADSDNSLVKGAGSVILVLGTGGQGVRGLNTGDSEFPNFVKADNTTYGFGKFTISESQITYTFVRSAGGTLSDSFTITDGPTPTPDPNQPTLTQSVPVPTLTPTKTPTPTLTPLPGTQSILIPTADTYASNDIGTADTNFGTRTQLGIDGSPAKVTYLKFDLSSLIGKTLTTATLRVHTANTSGAESSSTQNVKTVADTGWTETGLTYNNRPSVGATIGSLNGTAASIDTTYDIPLTVSNLQNSIGGILSLAIDSTGSNGLDINSREAATGKPQLILGTSGPGETSSPTPSPSACPSIPTDLGVATTTVTIPTNGLYAIWSRINPSTSAKSYYLQIDNDCAITVGNDTGIVPDTWSWVNYRDGVQANSITKTLTSGSHVIKLIGKEPGLRIDRLLLTTDQSCIPTGMGGNCDAVTVTPSSIPSPTPTNIPTSITTSPPVPATNTPAPTNTPIPQSLTLSFDLLLHGIGLGGDNKTPGAAGNFSPINPSRNVTVSLVDGNNAEVVEQFGTILFNATEGNFLGTVSFPHVPPNGSYTVKIVSPRYLTRQVPGFITLTDANRGSTIPITQTTLIVGDSNGDNFLDILDFNIVRDCYSDALPPRACSDSAKKTSADLNDDGNVNGFDLNLYIRNLTNRTGN